MIRFKPETREECHQVRDYKNRDLTGGELVCTCKTFLQAQKTASDLNKHWNAMRTIATVCDTYNELKYRYGFEF